MVKPGRGLLIALLAVLVSSPNVLGFSISPLGVRQGSQASYKSSSRNSLRMARKNDPVYDRYVEGDSTCMIVPDHVRVGVVVFNMLHTQTPIVAFAVNRPYQLQRAIGRASAS